MRKIFPKSALHNSTLLHNRFILYLIFAITIGNICLFVSKNDIMSVGLLFVSGFLTSFFSKNMIVIMVVAMVVSNVFRFGNQGRDGFQTSSFETALQEAFDDTVEELEAFNQECDEEDQETDDYGNRCCPSKIVDGVCRIEEEEEEEEEKEEDYIF